MKIAVPILMVMIVFSCSLKRENSVVDGQIIRTFNSRAVYKYIYERTTGTEKLMERYSFFKRKLDELESKNTVPVKNSLRKHYLEELKKIEINNKIIKERILIQIKRTVVRVSQRHGYDLVLKGESSVIYSRKTYDITSEIIQEIKSNAKKNSFIWK